MDKQELFKIFLKVLLYAVGLIAAYFGVSSVTSCSVSREFTHSGTGYFQYYDTLNVNGSSSVSKSIYRYGK